MLKDLRNMHSISGEGTSVTCSKLSLQLLHKWSSVYYKTVMTLGTRRRRGASVVRAYHLQKQILRTPDVLPRELNDANCCSNQNVGGPGNTCSGESRSIWGIVHYVQPDADWPSRHAAQAFLQRN